MLDDAVCGLPRYRVTLLISKLHKSARPAVANTGFPETIFPLTAPHRFAAIAPRPERWQKRRCPGGAQIRGILSGGGGGSDGAVALLSLDTTCAREAPMTVIAGAAQAKRRKATDICEELGGLLDIRPEPAMIKLHCEH